MIYKNGSILKGIRVLDLSQYLSGPFCTSSLADFGAEVILVERPDRPKGAGPYINGERIYTLSTFRGKKSVTLNLKKEEDKEIFLKLAEASDVIVENFKPGTMDNMGLGYEACKKRNPGIIYAAISGFGYTGPYRARGAMDVVIQAMSGIMSLTGEPDGKPTKVGPSISDIVAGLFCSIAVMGALYHKQATGVGQFIDIAMLDCSVACMENAVATYFATGKTPTRVGNRHQSAAPFQNFQAADGDIYIAVGRDTLFDILCKVLGMPELANDERFAKADNRRLNVKELEKEITKGTSTKTVAELEALLCAAGIPAGRINTIESVVNDSQIVERGLIWPLDHPVAGTYKVAGSPIKMSETTPYNLVPCPTLGQHTQEVLNNVLHMPQEQIKNFLEDQVKSTVKEEG